MEAARIVEAQALTDPADAPREPDAPSTKTILFVMGHRGFIRNYEPSLRLLDERGHQIHIIYLDARARKGERVFAEWLAGACPGITVAQAPVPEKGIWPTAARATRLLMDCVRYFDSHFERATILRERANRMVAGWLRGCLRVAGLFGDRGVRAAIGALRHVDAAIPISGPVVDLVDELQPDLVLVTPLIDWASGQTEYVKAAQAQGIPAGCCVASWDNLTNKGHLRVVPDRVFVWNEAQREEAVTLHGIPPANVVVTGAQLFDHWFGWRPARSREEFCHEVGLDPERRFVIFLGSTQWIAPTEIHFVERWIRHIRSADDPDVANLGILVRPHPTTAWRYLSMDLSQEHNVAVWPPYTAELIDYYTDEGKNDFFESLHNAAVAVGVNTSAMIEAGIVGLPTCTIRDEEFTHAHEGTLHFGLLTDTAKGLLRSAESLDEHTRDLAKVISAGRTAESRSFVEAFVRPHGLHLPAAPILADAIEEAAALPPRPRPTSRLTHWTLRLVLYPGALLLQVFRPFAQPRAHSMPFVSRFARLWAHAFVTAHALAAAGPWLLARLRRRL